MDCNKNIDRFTFVADSFLTDKIGRMRPTTLCNNMLNCGWRHGEVRGMGNTSTLGWVLARLALHIGHTPMAHERFYVDTWIRNLYHGFTDRCIRAVNEDGEEIASMLTTFAMIDLRTRSAVDLNGDIGVRLNECIVPDEPLGIRRIPSINRTPVEEVTFRLRPTYSDVDFNGHMNSIRYLDRILDAMPLDYMHSHNLTDFVAAYMKEGSCDEELSFGIKEIAPDNYLAKVTKEDGTPAVNIELKFEPI